MKDLLSALLDRVLSRLIGARRYSYAQSGEDLIIRRCLTRMGLRSPTYLDIGANDPVALNNTYLLYKKGSHGVLVEPDPSLCAELRRVRPRDAVINAALSRTGGGEAELHIFENRAFNTFDADRARQLIDEGRPLSRRLMVPLLTIDHVIERHAAGSPNLISIDAEGMDLEILESLDFDRFRPEVICVETLHQEADGAELKSSEIPRLLAERGYLAFADTYINTIFVDHAVWMRRKG